MSEDRRPKIAVIGDIMIDVDHHCRCERVSQEGPWPVFSIERTERRLGAAGNVAEMAAALGADCMLFGLAEVEDLPFHRADSLQVILASTTVKHRFFVEGKLTGPRVDHDAKHELTHRIVDQWLSELVSWKPDAIIVADHGKGVVTKGLMERLSELGIPLFLDPVATTPSPGSSPRSMAARYPSAIVAHDHEMPRWFRAECVIRKFGAAGLRWCDGPNDGELPSACQNLVDALGAGDQFIAALAYQRCLGLSWADAIEWANVAAGLQCERRGCQPVTVSEVESRSISQMTLL